MSLKYRRGKCQQYIYCVKIHSTQSLFLQSNSSYLYMFFEHLIFFKIFWIFFGRLTMYNGIGLETARGSGTNGYVQRNLSFLRKHKDRVDYKSEEELKKLDEQLIKQPNKEILDHERKRKVELKCMEMQVLMEEQGQVNC